MISILLRITGLESATLRGAIDFDYPGFRHAEVFWFLLTSRERHLSRVRATRLLHNQGCRRSTLYYTTQSVSHEPLDTRMLPRLTLGSRWTMVIIKCFQQSNQLRSGRQYHEYVKDLM